VIAALAVTSLSGVLMHGWFMTRISKHLQRDGGIAPKLRIKLQFAATASLGLWFAVVLAGTLLSIA
jgi:hypothetical protein